jgi:hypothetical protein
MIRRTIARRLEDLEAELLPVAGETKTIRVNYFFLAEDQRHSRKAKGWNESR